MVKHTQTIRRQKPTNGLSVFDHFVRLTLKGPSVTEAFIETFPASFSRSKSGIPWHQNNMWNLFKAYNEETRMRSL